MRITAKEAIALSGPTTNDYMNDAYNEIRKAAKGGQRKVFLSDSFWGTGGYNIASEWKRACEILRSDGFKVEYHMDATAVQNPSNTVISW